MNVFLRFRSAAPAATVHRAIIVLAVVLGVFATVGWTAARCDPQERTAWESALADWNHDRLPAPDSAPQTLSRWFAEVGTARGQLLADRHPLVVGNLDGAPPALRYRANRRAVARELALEERQLRELALTPQGREQRHERIAVLRSLQNPARHILAFDPAGTGQVAEVHGDLARAERVAVVVPGVDTKLSNFRRFAADGKPGYVAPAGMADALYDAVREAAPGRRTAVIAWADYAAPAGLGVDAATGVPAEAGAARLARFASALPGRPRTSLFCHSYGSVVCGVAAARLPASVTDITVAGSPGMRADDAAALHSTARIWATRAVGDWISGVPHVEVAGLGHGADPVAAEFGAHVFPAGTARGHTEYFRPGTRSLRTFAAIAAGEALQRA
ncbi:alpha/beta hydrolase [Streptomyces polyrhachis]|uniref:Alpha/beta hydrolase n=1 Tax=Streptomyces polyrhachis TaxID=1282885 RepID=A0ABW2GN99_9ACTN